MAKYSFSQVMLRYREVPETLPLFEQPEPELKSRLKDRLRRLAGQKHFLGGSSWKYEGWLGQVYTPERYLVRGRFSRKRFEQECLAEYAETFPIVCGDFSFYQFPSQESWERLFGAAPQLQLAFKVPEEITVQSFPGHPRYGARGGSLNPNFLHAELLEAEFLRLLTPYRGQTSLILFEFTAFPPGAFGNAEAFAETLSDFLGALPTTFRYGVEIRNPEFLQPAYLQVLSQHRVAHVLNSWTRMPPLSEQLNFPGVFTTDFTVSRALLRPGRPYEEAVRLFAPYSSTRDPNQEVRDALRNLLIRAKQRSEPTFIFVNNRLEGNSPNTIAAITEDL
jgi:uncharacterized protein YecE (DUF72 family)